MRMNASSTLTVHKSTNPEFFGLRFGAATGAPFARLGTVQQFLDLLFERAFSAYLAFALRRRCVSGRSVRGHGSPRLGFPGAFEGFRFERFQRLHALVEFTKTLPPLSPWN